MPLMVKSKIKGVPTEMTAVKQQREWMESHGETSIYFINNLTILLANTGTSVSEVIQ